MLANLNKRLIRTETINRWKKERNSKSGWQWNNIRIGKCKTLFFCKKNYWFYENSSQLERSSVSWMIIEKNLDPRYRFLNDEKKMFDNKNDRVFRITFLNRLFCKTMVLFSQSTKQRNSIPKPRESIKIFLWNVISCGTICPTASGSKKLFQLQLAFVIVLFNERYSRELNEFIYLFLFKCLRPLQFSAYDFCVNLMDVLILFI